VTQRYSIEARSPLFDGLDDVHVVFHGINKSGSLAMANVLREALIAAGREEDALSHYHLPGIMPLDEYRSLIEAKSGRFLAVGHYLYGFLRPATRRIWVTQFRHPLPKLVSCYKWRKNKHIQRTGSADGFPDLSQFVRNGRGVGDSQVAQLGWGWGRFRKSRAKKALSPETLYELSVEAIERDFTAIGIAEHFEESIFTFAALLGIPSVAAWAADTRNNGRRAVDELTSGERDLVREVYHWDFVFYDWLLKRFKEQSSRIEFGAALEQYESDCSNQYRDRLLGSTADEGVANWLMQHPRREHPEPKAALLR
jgi:hypothetical protein